MVNLAGEKSRVEPRLPLPIFGMRRLPVALQLVPAFPTGYGFTAIIVAFLGRLNPLGVIFAGLVLAISYVGGEIAQTTLGLPSAATGIFQGMLLFFLLAGDVFVRYRLRAVSARPAGSTT